MNSSDLIRFFSQRKWRTEKTISDLLQGVTYHFQGHLEFREASGYLLSEETGQVFGPTGHHESSKRYYYRLKDSSVIDVLFENKSFFHSLECDLYPKFQIHHHCGDDIYIGSYEFEQNAWTTTWDVTGPNKKYILRALYE